MARWLLPTAAVAAVGIAWWHWGANEPQSATRPAPALPPIERVVEASDIASPEGAGEPSEPDRPAEQIAWETVRSVCPWPPLPSSWLVLDEPCLSAMNRLDDNPEGGAPPGWRDVLLDDPLGTRRAVEAALDRPECGVVTLADDWPGNVRPDLREACAAEEMIRLASLQDKCLEKLHADWVRIKARTQAMIEQAAETLEEYHTLVESDHRRSAHNFWRNYMCRKVPPEALEWVEALPVPPGDPTAHRYNRPPITQALDLYDAARRLGAEIPDWALGRLELEAEIAKRREQDP